MELTYYGIRDVTQSRREQIQHPQIESARGKPPLSLARTIQSQWGDFKDCSDTQLAMRLTRLRKQMALGEMRKQMHSTIRGQQQTIQAQRKER
jgi:hypothetical protein